MFLRSLVGAAQGQTCRPGRHITLETEQVELVREVQAQDHNPTLWPRERTCGTSLQNQVRRHWGPQRPRPTLGMRVGNM